MMKQEFEERVGMKVSNDEFDAINVVYMITNKVRKELEKANIDYMEYNYIKMQNDFKQVASLVHEIQEYINKQVA